ncbi:MAG: hypothetical protein ACR2N4_15995 [Jatrophihabitans sp.]
MMARHNGGSWLDQLVGACFSLLVGAAALYVTVHLLERVWVALVLILAISAASAIGWRIFRQRDHGW